MDYITYSIFSEVLPTINNLGLVVEISLSFLFFLFFEKWPKKTQTHLLLLLLGTYPKKKFAKLQKIRPSPQQKKRKKEKKKNQKHWKQDQGFFCYTKKYCNSRLRGVF
jgi:hypothetical protein